MRKRLIIILSAFLLMGGYVAGVVYATDPCQGTTAEIQFAKIQPTASPGTYSLVGVKTDASGTNGRRIFVCGYEMTVGGTTPTYQYEEGPGAACSPSPTALTGAYAPTSGNMVRGGEAGQKIISTDPGQGLCVVTGGTTPSLNGVLEFVVVP
jgi:hypothetical protein